MSKACNQKSTVPKRQQGGAVKHTGILRVSVRKELDLFSSVDLLLQLPLGGHEPLD